MEYIPTGEPPAAVPGDYWRSDYKSGLFPLCKNQDFGKDDLEHVPLGWIESEYVLLAILGGLMFCPLLRTPSWTGSRIGSRIAPGATYLRSPVGCLRDAPQGCRATSGIAMAAIQENNEGSQLPGQEPLLPTGDPQMVRSATNPSPSSRPP